MLPELLVYLAFLGSFAFIRTSAHMIRAQVKWWPGNVDVGGTHVHHLVWGIIAMMLTGWASLSFAPDPPVREVLAVLFGIGAGLTMDEFALWLHLQDVYWKPQGRESIDAVIVAGVSGAVVLLGLRFWLDLGDDAAAALEYGLPGTTVLGVLTAVVCLWRRRWLLAAFSLVLPVVGWVGLAVQLVRTRRSASSRADSTSARTSSRGSRKRVST